MTGTRVCVVGGLVLIAGIIWIALGPKDDDIQNYGPPTVVAGVVVFCTGLILRRLDRRD